MARQATSPTTPGFKLSLGISASFLFLMVLLPLGAMVLSSFGSGWQTFWTTVSSPSALASYRLTILSSAFAALVNGVFGFITAWALVRYRIPGRNFFDSLIDLPFAVPGSVGGIAIAALVSPNGLLGQFLVPAGIEIAYTAYAVPFALVYSGLPFVVRAVQPVIESLDPAEEEASVLLGATSFKTFTRVILPSILPALASGCLLAFIRGLGEFGTVIFVSGNIPFVSEVSTQVIYDKIFQYDRAGAASISLVLVAVTALSMGLAALAAPLGRWYKARVSKRKGGRA